MKTQELIALNSRQLPELKKEIKYLALLFILLAVVFKIIFYKESTMIILRLLFSLFYIIILPGYFVMLVLAKKLGFKERIVIGIAAGTAVIGIISYYLGIIGLHVKYHFILLPLIVMIIAYVLFCMSRKKSMQKIYKHKEINEDGDGQEKIH